jgi:hypothetical protein
MVDRARKPADKICQRHGITGGEIRDNSCHGHLQTTPYNSVSEHLVLSKYSKLALRKQMLSSIFPSRDDATPTAPSLPTIAAFVNSPLLD